VQKKRILFLVLHRPNRSPSQRYRFEQYLSFLEEHGFEFEFSYLINAKDDKIFYGKGNYLGKLRILLKSIFKRFRDIRRAKNYDIAFVQRESFMLGSSYFERRIAKKTKMVFDFDDAIWMHVVSENNKSLGFLKNGAKTGEIISCSHLIFAGNDFLADYARQFNSNVKIIPTTVDTDFHKPSEQQKAEEAPICIGWSGSFSTIEHFKLAIPVLHRLKEKYGNRIEFKVLGDPNFRYEPLGIQGLAWSHEGEVPALQTMDIGIMPLPKDEWTKGKCGLKGLLYMAVGIPSVMANVGVNPEIVEDGVNGMLCDPENEEEWFQKLCQLIEDKELRSRLGAAGRQHVIEHYSVLAQRQHYLDAFNTLIQD
jgi:glycosyltransferase involved in cell wall biosynthesis